MRTFFLDFVLKLLSAQRMRTSPGSLTTRENLPSPRPMTSVRIPATATQGSCSQDSVTAQSQPCPGQPATSRECLVAARDRTIIPTCPSKSPSSLRRPEATRLLWPWLVTSHSRPPRGQARRPSSIRSPSRQLHRQRPRGAQFHTLFLEVQRVFFYRKTRGYLSTY